MEPGTMELAGARLRLLPAAPALAEAAAAYYTRNRAFLQPFEPVRPAAFYTPAGQAACLAQEQAAAAARAAFRWYLVPAGASGPVVGAVGLNHVVWGAFRSAFLGYKLDADWLNRGLMTEAVALVTACAFGSLGLHRIEANVMPRSAPSLQVLEKNGYRSEGLARRYLNINGVWEDHIHMARLAEDPPAEKGGSHNG